MAKIRTPVPNLIGGVSQQPDVIRRAGQATESINAWPDPVEGLVKRHPFNHLANICDGADLTDPDLNLLVHTINRGEGERYIALIYKDSVKVFDADTGVEYPVHDPVAPYVPDFQYINETAINEGNEITDGDDFAGPTWILSGGGTITELPLETPPAEIPGFNVWRFQQQNAASSSSLTQNPTATLQAGGTSLSIYIKEDTVSPPVAAAKAFGLRIIDVSIPNVGTNNTRVFDWTGGVPVESASSATGTPTVVDVTNVGGGWFRITLGVLPFGDFLVGDSIQLQFVTDHVPPLPPFSNLHSVLIWGVSFETNSDTTDFLADPASGGALGPLKALTINDFTFVTNTSRVTGLGVTESPQFPVGTDEALIFVNQAGINDTNYHIDIKLETELEVNITVSSAMTGTGTDSDTDIASDLQIALQAVPNVTAVRSGSVVHIAVTGLNPIEKLDVHDSRSDTLMTKVHKNIDSFDRLPLTATDGYVIEISGSLTSDLDNYWLIFQADEVGAFGVGQWAETVAPQLAIDFAVDNLPHQLTRKFDDGVGTVTGTPDQLYFEWTTVNWSERLVGDDETNAVPSFITTDANFPKTVNDLFFYQGRLGLLSDQGVILSGSSDFFNFWRTTVTSLPDDEPIDVQANHTRVSILNHAVPFNEQLVLFSDRTQFIASGGGDVLTPRTIGITPALEFENLVRPTPGDLGTSVLFAYQRGDFSGLREVFQATDVSLGEDDVDAQIPSYIEGSIRTIAASTLSNTVCVLADGDPTQLYVYKFFVTGREKRQSAWQRYQLSGTILGVSWIEDQLYVVVQRTEGVFLERARVSSGISDSGATYLTYLDRRITEEGLTIAYDNQTDLTTITLPYEIESTSMAVVTREDAASGTDGGQSLQVSSATLSQNDIVIEGDHSADALWIGETFELRYEMSKPVVKEGTATGGLAPVSAVGRHVLLAINLSFTDTADFKVEIQPDFRDLAIDQFNFVTLQETILGVLNLVSGRLRTGIFADARRVTVSIVSDSPLPLKLQAAEWEASFNTRGNRGGAV